MTPPAPEVGPWLGVVASPRPRPDPGGVPLDAVRMVLVGQLLEQGRAAHPDWLAAWRNGVEAASQRTLETISAAARAAAQASRAPQRVARTAHPEPDDIRILRARIASTGIPLEAMLASLGESPDPARAFPAIGGAVEESWLELEAMVRAVTDEWAPRAAAVARWRRPTAPLWIVTGLSLGTALAAGLALGGYVAAPEWFQPVIAWWWSLPWP